MKILSIYDPAAVDSFGKPEKEILNSCAYCQKPGVYRVQVSEREFFYTCEEHKPKE